MLDLWLFCLAVFPFAANAAAPNNAATNLAGFLPGERYAYSYSSSADVYQDLSLTASATVSYHT